MPAAPGDGAVLLKGRDGDHADRWFTLPVLRGKQVHRRARRVSFAVRPRRRFGPPQAGTSIFRPPTGSVSQHMVPQVRVSARGQRHPTLRPSAGPDQQCRPGLLRTREQLPEVALAVADRHHPAVRAGAREFLRPLQAVPQRTLSLSSA